MVLVRGGRGCLTFRRDGKMEQNRKGDRGRKRRTFQSVWSGGGVRVGGVLPGERRLLGRGGRRGALCVWPTECVSHSLDFNTQSVDQ